LRSQNSPSFNHKNAHCFQINTPEQSVALKELNRNTPLEQLLVGCDRKVESNIPMVVQEHFGSIVLDCFRFKNSRCRAIVLLETKHLTNCLFSLRTLALLLLRQLGAQAAQLFRSSVPKFGAILGETVYQFVETAAFQCNAALFAQSIKTLVYSWCISEDKKAAT
jgi:hypothetical protein